MPAIKEAEYSPHDAITGSSGCLTMDLILPEHFPKKLPNSFPKMHKTQTIQLQTSNIKLIKLFQESAPKGLRAYYKLKFRSYKKPTS